MECNFAVNTAKQNHTLRFSGAFGRFESDFIKKQTRITALTQVGWSEMSVKLRFSKVGAFIMCFEHAINKSKHLAELLFAFELFWTSHQLLDSAINVAYS